MICDNCNMWSVITKKKKKTTATCHVVGFDIALMSFSLNIVVSKKWVIISTKIDATKKKKKPWAYLELCFASFEDSWKSCSLKTEL